MASGLVDVVVEKLGGMIIDQIKNEVSLVCNFKKDFQWLSKKLTNIRGCLREADLQGAHDKSVKSWLLDVAEIAWDAEDILEECAVQSQGTNNEGPQSSCVRAFSYSQLAFRYKMARRIKDLKDRMKSIMKDAEDLKLFQDLTHLDLPSTSASEFEKLRRSSPLIESDSRPVAIESKVKEVLRLIDDPATPVIAVVGMGGVGKTFLLQHVFDKRKNMFEKSIWLAVSQNYSLQKLQVSLALKIDLHEVVKERVNETDAAVLIHDRLASKRSLIVLDDVWRATEEENLISALGLPTGDKTQCKIVVSTRSRDVCRHIKAHVYEMQLLSEEDSWKLFCAFAFPDCPQNQPPDQQLEEIARQIDGECGKLPLAVKTVAASLAGKRFSWEWESKLRQLKAPSHTDNRIMQILKMSYDSLPAFLKPCFAYLSFFPEDEKIDPEYLINLWKAEGFIPQEEDQDQLDIGWSFIYHLHNLCLIEMIGNIYDRLDISCKLHDLLLDLSISISKESKCAFSMMEVFQKGPTEQTSMEYRRILLGKKSRVDDDVDVMASKQVYPASCLRTLSLSQNRGFHQIPKVLLSSVRVLRVLDLSDTNISSLDACIGNLKLLRALNLRGTQITEVPACIKSNKSLLFLDVSWCSRLEQLPEWIGKLNCLEHLDMRGMEKGKFEGLMPKGISELLSLQVLRSSQSNKLSIENNKFLKLEDFVHLIKLREVRIDIHHRAELQSVEDGILAELVKMRNLKICNAVTGNANGCNLPRLSEKMLAMRNLELLDLDRFAVPEWICRFSNMMQLTLTKCHCAEYPALEMMHNLRKLELNINSNCKTLPKGFGKSGGFPQLRQFKIWGFPVLEELPELQEEAMPRLEFLHVRFCPKLGKVPLKWKLLKTLKDCIFGTSETKSGPRPVAIESKVQQVFSLLDNLATPVIAVVGMGGVGKTFLMQNVFNRIKDKFEKWIWLSISQTYSLKKLQADMAWQIKSQAGENSEIKSQADMVINGQISEVQAAQWIHSCLTNRSSLIVLDDVWRATGEDDLISAIGLPTVEDSRCRIVVTTRSRHVSSNMNAHVYEVHPLSQQESWELFCAFAFPDSQKNQPPQQLEGIARQVEGECGRLPLAVKTVAASLAGKRLSRDWETELGQLRAASYTEDPIMQILKLSYDSLPVHLKPCFAYLSFFPEDKEIDSVYLINLWIAEGYIPQKEDQHQLDIGWNYLCHLHSLCLVEKVGDMYDQGSGRFKLHDLLLDLAISMGKESQCAFSVDESFRKGPAVQASCSYRRILMGKKSIVDGDVDVMASNRAYSASRLRTLSFSQNNGIQKLPAILLSGARVLRVLDLSGTQISSLPACVGNLKLLRVLNLSETKIAEVPKCVKSNTSLRFLDISHCRNLEQLPEWIGELNFLEHLNLQGNSLKKIDGSMPKGLSKLVSLQVLITDVNHNKLSVDDNEFLRLEHFVNLVNLRKVWLGIHHEAELRSIEDGILSTLVKMRTLGILNETHVTEVNLPPLSEKMLAIKDLEFLHLYKFAVPNWICGFSNLMQLLLFSCDCAEYPALEMMPNLIKLEIVGNNICKALPKGFGKSKGFPQLLFLEIVGCSVLEEFLELEDGAMPHLEILNVFDCRNLKKVPSGLEHLRSLKECHFRRTGVDDMLKEDKELWNKMKVNNSNVIIKIGW